MNEFWDYLVEVGHMYCVFKHWSEERGNLSIMEACNEMVRWGGRLGYPPSSLVWFIGRPKR